MRRYPLGESGQTISISDGVIAHFAGQRQLRLWSREAGGLLFARLLGSEVFIDHATGPRPGDRRARHSYWPDRVAEQREIDRMHFVDLHFVGTWHTHPEDEPTPSGVDMRSMKDIFAKSQHSLNGFVMVIVGRVASEAGLFFAIWDGAHLNRLFPKIPVSAETRGSIPQAPSDAQEGLP